MPLYFDSGEDLKTESMPFMFGHIHCTYIVTAEDSQISRNTCKRSINTLGNMSQ